MRSTNTLRSTLALGACLATTAVQQIGAAPATAATNVPTSSSWTWTGASTNDGTAYKPSSATAFTLVLAGGKITVAGDCNTLAATAAPTVDQPIKFTDVVALTKRLCAGSSEDAYVKLLKQVGSSYVDAAGNLVLELAHDSGSMVFRRTDAPVTHTVQRGDTISAIARLYKLDRTTLVKLNGLTNPNRLKVGQVLKLVGGERTHTVVRGDTVAAISRRYHVSMKKIVDANKLTSPNRLRPGQKLVIPM